MSCSEDSKRLHLSCNGLPLLSNGVTESVSQSILRVFRRLYVCVPSFKLLNQKRPRLRYTFRSHFIYTHTNMTPAGMIDASSLKSPCSLVPSAVLVGVLVAAVLRKLLVGSVLWDLLWVLRNSTRNRGALWSAWVLLLLLLLLLLLGVSLLAYLTGGLRVWLTGRVARVWVTTSGTELVGLAVVLRGIELVASLALRGRNTVGLGFSIAVLASRLLLLLLRAVWRRRGGHTSAIGVEGLVVEIVVVVGVAKRRGTWHLGLTRLQPLLSNRVALNQR